MKKFCNLFLILVILCAFLASCDYRFDVHEDDDADYSHMVLIPYGENEVTIKFEGASKWYSCTDKSGANASLIDGEESETLTVTIVDKDIKFFKAESETGSKIFYVAKTGLPTVYINTDSGKPITTRETYVSGTIEILAKKNGLEKQSMTIKGRGNSSFYDVAKKGYNFKLDKKEKILGMKKEKKWVLISNYRDDIKLGNWFSSYLAHDVFNYKEWSAAFEYVDLVINGQYYGNFILGEAVKISKQRVNIRDISTIGNSEADAEAMEDFNRDNIDFNGDGKVNLYDGGFIIEVDYNRDSTAQFSTARGVPLALKDPDLEEYSGKYGYKEIFYHIQGIMQNLENYIYDESKNLGKVFDIDSFVDWYLMNELMGNWEAGFHTSVYMYYEPTDGKIHMSTLWDFDMGILKNDGCQTNSNGSLWVRQLLSRKDIQTALKNRLTEDLEDNITSAIDALVDKQNKLNVSLKFDQLRWSGTLFSQLNEDNSARLAGIYSRVEWFFKYIKGLGK